MKLSKFPSQLTNSGIRDHKSKEITNAYIFAQALCMNIAIRPFFTPFHHGARMNMLSALVAREESTENSTLFKNAKLHEESTKPDILKCSASKP